MTDVVSDVNTVNRTRNNTTHTYPRLYNINNLTVTNADASFDKMVIRFRVMVNSTSTAETIHTHLNNIHYRIYNKDIKLFYNNQGSPFKASCDIIHKKNGIHCMLAGTKLQFTRAQGYRDRYKCSVALNINPTRFLAIHYGHRPSEFSLQHLANIQVNEELFLYQQPNNIPTLDANDNYLNNELHEITRNQFADATAIIIAKAIEWITDVVVEERMGVEHASDVTEYIIAGQSFGLRLVPGMGRTYLSISSVETYFEYGANGDAVYKAREINNIIKACVAMGTFKDYEILQDSFDSQAELPTETAGQDVLGLSSASSVKIGSSIQVKVYAKTFNRIRFKIEFTRNVKTLCEATGVHHIEDFTLYLQKVIEASVARFRYYFRDMQSRYIHEGLNQANTPAVDSLMELMRILLDSFENNMERIRQIMQILITERKITIPREGSVHISQTEINRLKRKGVLIKSIKTSPKNTTGFKSYQLNTRYNHLTERMLEILGI